MRFGVFSMFAQFTRRADEVKMWGLKDDAMYLSEVRTTYTAWGAEVIESVFTDHREQREYPDFAFAFIYPPHWSATDIRNFLFVCVSTAEKAYAA